MTIVPHAHNASQASLVSQKTPHARRCEESEAVILFSVGRQAFAIAADAVQEVRSTDSIAGSASEIAELSVPKVRHTIERGPHLYFVVNAGVHFHLPVTRPTLVLVLRQFRVAVLVDRIEEMAEIPAVFNLPRAFTGDERRWYRGLAYVNDHVIPVINPAGFISDSEFRLLDSATRPQSQPQHVEGVISA